MNYYLNLSGLHAYYTLAEHTKIDDLYTKTSARIS